MSRLIVKNQPDWVYALTRELESWLGTPYVEGQGRKGVGADCLGFGAGVYDALHGLDPAKAAAVPRHAQDVALHNPREAARVTLKIAERWPSFHLGRGAALEPGDALVVRNSARGGGGHLMIVGPDPSVLWHCVYGGDVCTAGAARHVSGILYHWRSLERSSWRHS